MGQQGLFDPPPLRDPHEDRGPSPSHTDGRSTERSAAAMNRPRAGTQRASVLHEIAVAGDYGHTAHEVNEILGFKRTHIAGARIGELASDGWVEDSGNRRKTDTGSPAIVWRLTEFGRQQYVAPERRRAA